MGHLHSFLQLQHCLWPFLLILSSPSTISSCPLAVQPLVLPPLLIPPSFSSFSFFLSFHFPLVPLLLLYSILILFLHTCLLIFFIIWHLVLLYKFSCFIPVTILSKYSYSYRHTHPIYSQLVLSMF